jgi:hypothetical protein
MLKYVLGLLFAGACGAAEPVHGSAQASPEPSPVVETPSRDPIDHCEFAFETGVMWKLGGGATPLAYTFLPQMLTIKIPPRFRFKVAGGDLILRSRFSLLIEPIIKGPETHYIAADGAGSLEWWSHDRNTNIFFASGGGMGGMNSKGYEIRGGQGQDLNFNWLLYLGAQRSWNKHFSTSLGLYFQHVSNTGLDKVNPGVNALGPMLGILYRY